MWTAGSISTDVGVAFRHFGIALALLVGWGANALLTLAQQRLGRWRLMESGREP